MIKFNPFSRLKNIFSWLNPMPLYNNMNEMKMSEDFDTFDGGLGISNLAILFKIYGKEKISKESRENYENFLKITYPKEYKDFLEYKLKLEQKTPNIKQIIFDWMDGKIELPEFELFDVY